jgi:hypothetical protein
MNVRIPIQLLIIALLPAVVTTADPDTAPATQPTRLMLHPAPLPRPVLKYRLMPDVIDLTPGNAATMYLLASSRPLMGSAENPENRSELDALDGWLTAPPKEIDRARTERLISQFTGALRQAELGARRERCDWDLPARQEGFSTLLPYLQEMRLQGKLLALRARLAIADGRFDDAARALQTGFAMADHLNVDGFLIQTLVGASIASMMADQVEFWVSTRGSPNLYWPLTDLPAPFMDLRSAMRRERAGNYFAIPHLKEAGEGTLTAEQLREMMARLNELQEVVTEQSGTSKDGLTKTLGDAEHTLLRLPRANAFLTEMGYGKQALAAMQPAQAIGLWYALSYNLVSQEMTKSFSLPLFQGLAMESPEAELMRRKDPTNPLLSLLPAVSRVRLAAARLDRRIGELRSLEAIRAYSAAHDGNMPGTLAGLVDTPVPLDPVTGVAFPYRVENGMAILEAPLPPGGQAKDGQRYEVRVERGK